MLKNYYPTNLILHRFFDRLHNGYFYDRPVTPEIEAQMQSINPFLKCRPLALCDPGLDGGLPRTLRIFKDYRTKTDLAKLVFVHDGESIDIDGHEAFEDQEALVARPSLKVLNYFDDVLVGYLAHRLREQREGMECVCGLPCALPERCL